MVQNGLPACRGLSPYGQGVPGQGTREREEGEHGEALNEPNTGIPVFDWMVRYIGVLIPAGIAIVGGLIAIFHRYKMSVTAELQQSERNVDMEIAKVWAEIRNVLAQQSVHISDIAVLKVEQRNTWTSLVEIKTMVHDTNQKIDALFKEVVRRAT